MGALPHIASRPTGGLRLLAAEVAPGATAAKGRLMRIAAVVAAAGVSKAASRRMGRLVVTIYPRR